MAGDRERTLAALVVARAWRDPAYLQRLVAEPRAVFTEEGIAVPDDVDIRVHQDTREVKHIVLPPDLNAGDTDQVHALVSAVLPIPADSAAVLVQSGPTVKHFVVPHPPAALDPAATSEPALVNLAAAGSVSVYQDAVALTTAVQTEEVVTTTTEAQDVETSTTAAAEAEVVAVVAGVLV